eukprot:472367-Pleurochrysis_carterae.AAC.1
MMPSEPKPVGAQAAGLREALGDGCVDEDVVARAADRQYVLDGAEQLVVERFFLLAVDLRVEPLPELRTDGVALGRVEGDVLRAVVDERARRKENQPTLVRTALTFFASVAASSSGMIIISRTTASMDLRPSSKMLVIAWCAHLGSSLASSSLRTRQAALRAAAARSFIVHAGTKLRMRDSMASVMPTCGGALPSRAATP